MRSTAAHVTISIQGQLYRYSYCQISVTIHRRIDVSNTALIFTHMRGYSTTKHAATQLTPQFKVRIIPFCPSEMPGFEIWTIVTSRLGLGIVNFFSISIPWVRYRFLNDSFFDTNFMKSVLTRLHYLKKLVFFFSACWHLYRLKDSSPEPLHKGTKYIQHNKSVQIILIKLIVFSLH